MQVWADRISPDRVEALLNHYGIAGEFIGFSGEINHTPLTHRLGILSAMGRLPDSDEEIDRELARSDALFWQHWVSPVEIIDSPDPWLAISLSDQALKLPMCWQVSLENGAMVTGQWTPADSEELDQHTIHDNHYSKRLLQLSELPTGYHHLSLDNGREQQTCRLIVAPQRCHEPSWLLSGEKLWGISVQLYTMKTLDNLGHGDLADLRCLIGSFAAEGADFILINPLHALDNRHPDHASPYSPSDRRFLNPLYIHLLSEDDFRECDQLDELLHQARQSMEKLYLMPWLDYQASFSIKYRILDRMYLSFRQRHVIPGSSRGQAFHEWVASGGELLEHFARFQSCVDIPDVLSAQQPAFHLYLQWLAEQQLEECQRLAVASGMKLGIIRDLAVGSSPTGFEVASAPDLYSRSVRIGAPPDHFNPSGQDWGVVPMKPTAMARSGFDTFIQLLRRNMKHCGALRIDHIMSLMRLWWCPEDGSHGAGAYVYYPVRELFALLRLESQRAGTLVIGEDLGVVPPEIHHYLDQSAVLSNIVFYFEKQDEQHFRPPQAHRQRALAMVANHDVAPLKGWWNGDDIRLRRAIGLIADEHHLAREETTRHQEKCQVLALLDDQQLLPANRVSRDAAEPFDSTLGQAILRLCARSASQLLSVQLDDLANLDSPVNIPGTSAEYANWRRKMPQSLTAILASEHARLLLSGLRERRP